MVGILFCWFGLKEPHWWWEKRLLTVIIEGLRRLPKIHIVCSNLASSSFLTWFLPRERERVVELVVSCDLLLLMMERNDDVSFQFYEEKWSTWLLAPSHHFFGIIPQLRRGTDYP